MRYCALHKNWYAFDHCPDCLAPVIPVLDSKTIDPEYIDIDQPAESKSYYLYTGGVLKLVDREEPASHPEHHEYGSQYYGACVDEWSVYKSYVNSLPSIEVSEDLKRIWKDGQRVEEGKDFCIQFWTGSSWWPIEHLVDKKAKPGTRLKAFPIAAEPFKPDDHMTIIEMINWYDQMRKKKYEPGFILKQLISRYSITRK